MWKSFIGRSSDRPEESPSSKAGRRRDSEHHSFTRGSESTTSTRKSSRGDDRGKGFQPRSTSYSSTSKSRPGASAPSIASSYMTTGSLHDTDINTAPNIVRNPSEVDRLPQSSSKRDDRPRDTDRESQSSRRRDRSSSRERMRDWRDDRDEDKRDKRDKSYRRDREREKERDRDRPTSKGSMDRYIEYGDGAIRAADGNGRPSTGYSSSSLTQPPGQYDGGLYESSSRLSQPSARFSPRIEDQFPGQFPPSPAELYLPLAENGSSHGEASNYYGDHGQSVYDQPGVRPQPPSLIIGAEPHLLPASAVPNPPVEPSAQGNVGAAASYFQEGESESALSETPSRPNGKYSRPDKTSKPIKQGKQNGSYNDAWMSGGVTFDTSMTSSSYDASSRPDYVSNGASYQQRPPSSSNGHTHHHSAPVVPTLGAAAAGAAVGHYVGHQSSHQETAHHHSHSYSSTYEPQYTSDPLEQYQSDGRLSKPNGQPSSSNASLYVTGATGLGAAAYQHHHNHHHSADNIYGEGYSQMAYQPQHRGPLDKLLDLIQDKDGVAQMEEYTEYIGVCKDCFEPGTTARDAPRKHHYQKRRSYERFGSSSRIDKESRYTSSDSEARRKRKTSWLAGAGLAKLRKGLFSSNRDRDSSSDSVSIRKRRFNESRGSFSGRDTYRHYDQGSVTSRGVAERHRSRSRGLSEATTRERRIYKKVTHAGKTTIFEVPRHSGSRSRSRSRSRHHGSVKDAALGSVIGSAVASSVRSTRHRGGSPKKSYALVGRRSRESSSRERSPSLADILGLTEAGRRRMRRSPSPPRPSHSRVSSGASGFASFFTAPSMGRKSHSKKKSKSGFFSFSNASSSSSSDADLAFGSESDHSRKSSKRRKIIKKRRSTDSAILGLGAGLAAALAAGENRKGKRISDIYVPKSRGKKKGKHERNKKSRRGSSSSSAADDDAWESATEGHDSSDVSSGLAYGGAARKSQDSLVSDGSGTNKWGWTWGSKKKKRSTTPPKLVEDFSHVGEASTTGTAAGITLVSNESRDVAGSSTSSLPPLQRVYPIATSDPSRFDVTKQPTRSSNSPIMTSRPAPIPLQQPRPIAPVSPNVYTTQASYPHSYTAPTGTSSSSNATRVTRSRTDSFERYKVVDSQSQASFNSRFPPVDVAKSTASEEFKDGYPLVGYSSIEVRRAAIDDDFRGKSHRQTSFDERFPPVSGTSSTASEAFREKFPPIELVEHTVKEDSRNNNRQPRQDSSPALGKKDRPPSPIASRPRASTRDRASNISFNIPKEVEDKERFDKYRRQKEEIELHEKYVREQEEAAIRAQVEKQLREAKKKSEEEKRRSELERSDRKSAISKRDDEVEEEERRRVAIRKYEEEKSSKQSTSSRIEPFVAAAAVGAIAGSVLSQKSKSDERRERRREERRAEVESDISRKPSNVPDDRRERRREEHRVAAESEISRKTSSVIDDRRERRREERRAEKASESFQLKDEDKESKEKISERKSSASSIVSRQDSVQKKLERQDSRKDTKKTDPTVGWSERSAKDHEREREPRDDFAESDKQARIARKVAEKIAAKQEHQEHDDSGSYFTPPDITESARSEDIPFPEANNITPYHVPEIKLDDFGSNPSGHSHDYPTSSADAAKAHLLRNIPRLNVIEPTPPVSVSSSIRGDSSPDMPGVEIIPARPETNQRQSSGSKVTWGESETREFTVASPESSHEEFISTTELNKHTRSIVKSEAEKQQTQYVEKQSEKQPERPLENIPKQPLESMPERELEKGIEKQSEKKRERPLERMPERPLEKQPGNEPPRQSSREMEKRLDQRSEQRSEDLWEKEWEIQADNQSRKPPNRRSEGPLLERSGRVSSSHMKEKKYVGPKEVKAPTMPGSFGDDLEFAAIVAAGLEDTGFDPKIVTEDPAFFRRDSPPGSEVSGMYRKPFYESVPDVHSLPLSSAIIPPPRGFIEGEVPETSEDPEPTSKPIVGDNSPRRWSGISPDAQVNIERPAKSQSNPLSEAPSESNRREIASDNKENYKSSLQGQSTAVSEIGRTSITERHSVSDEHPSPLESPSSHDDTIPMAKGYSRSQIQSLPSAYSDVPHRSDSDREGILREEGHYTEEPEPMVELSQEQLKDLVDLEDLGSKVKSSSKHESSQGYSGLKRTSSSGSDMRKDSYYDARPVGSDEDRKEKKKKHRHRSSTLGLDDEDIRSVTSHRSHHSQHSRSRSRVRSHSRARSRERKHAESDNDEREKKKKKRHSAGDVLDWGSPGVRSVVSSGPGDDDSESKRRQKHRSKRDSGDFDTASVVSSPAAIDDSKESKPKKKSLLSQIFSVSKAKEEATESSRPRPRSPHSEASFDGSDKKHKKRHHRHSTGDDVNSIHGSEASRSASNLSQISVREDDDESQRLSKSRSKEEKRRSREGSIVESGRITRDLTSEVPSPVFPTLPLTLLDQQLSNQKTTEVIDKQQSRSRSRHKSIPEGYEDKPLSFLGERPEIPPLPDGSRTLEDPPGQRVAPPPLEQPFTIEEPHTPSRLSNPFPLSSTDDVERTPKGHSRHNSELSQTSGLTSSPTAVPLHFRRPPRSPAARRISYSSPGSPQTDFVYTPKSRKERPASTEFKTSTEYRPLWLVERHSSSKVPEVDEPYPPLPSSRASSSTPSLPDDSPEHQWEEAPEFSFPSFEGPAAEQEASIVTMDAIERGDVLSSGQTTPTAANFSTAFRSPVSVVEPTPAPRSDEANTAIVTTSSTPGTSTDSFQPFHDASEDLPSEPEAQQFSQNVAGTTHSQPLSQPSSPTQHEVFEPSILGGAAFEVLVDDTVSGPMKDWPSEEDNMALREAQEILTEEVPKDRPEKQVQQLPLVSLDQRPENAEPSETKPDVEFEPVREPVKTSDLPETSREIPADQLLEALLKADAVTKPENVSTEATTVSASEEIYETHEEDYVEVPMTLKETKESKAKEACKTGPVFTDIPPEPKLEPDSTASAPVEERLVEPAHTLMPEPEVVSVGAVSTEEGPVQPTEGLMLENVPIEVTKELEEPTQVQDPVASSPSGNGKKQKGKKSRRSSLASTTGLTAEAKAAADTATEFLTEVPVDKPVDVAARTTELSPATEATAYTTTEEPLVPETFPPEPIEPPSRPEEVVEPVVSEKPPVSLEPAGASIVTDVHSLKSEEPPEQAEGLTGAPSKKSKKKKKGKKSLLLGEAGENVETPKSEVKSIGLSDEPEIVAGPSKSESKITEPDVESEPVITAESIKAANDTAGLSHPEVTRLETFPEPEPALPLVPSEVASNVPAPIAPPIIEQSIASTTLDEGDPREPTGTLSQTPKKSKKKRKGRNSVSSVEPRENIETPIDVGPEPTQPKVEEDLEQRTVPTAAPLEPSAGITETGVSTDLQVPILEVVVPEQSVTEEHAAEEPVLEKPTVEEPLPGPIPEEVVPEAPTSKELLSEAPIFEKLVPEKPVSETFIPEVPAPKEPVSENIVPEELIYEAPAPKRPVSEEPVHEAPIFKEFVPEQPVSEEPIPEEAIAKEPTPEQHVSETLLPINSTVKSSEVKSDPGSASLFISPEVAELSVQTSTKEPITSVALGDEPSGIQDTSSPASSKKSKKKKKSKTNTQQADAKVTAEPILEPALDIPSSFGTADKGDQQSDMNETDMKKVGEEVPRSDPSTSVVEGIPEHSQSPVTAIVTEPLEIAIKLPENIAKEIEAPQMPDESEPKPIIDESKEKGPDQQISEPLQDIVQEPIMEASKQQPVEQRTPLSQEISANPRVEETKEIIEDDTQSIASTSHKSKKKKNKKKKKSISLAGENDPSIPMEGKAEEQLVPGTPKAEAVLKEIVPVSLEPIATEKPTEEDNIVETPATEREVLEGISETPLQVQPVEQVSVQLEPELEPVPEVPSSKKSKKKNKKKKQSLDLQTTAELDATTSPNVIEKGHTPVTSDFQERNIQDKKLVSPSTDLIVAGELASTQILDQAQELSPAPVDDLSIANDIHQKPEAMVLPTEDESNITLDTPEPTLQEQESTSAEVVSEEIPKEHPDSCLVPEAQGGDQPAEGPSKKDKRKKKKKQKASQNETEETLTTEATAPTKTLTDVPQTDAPLETPLETLETVPTIDTISTEIPVEAGPSETVQPQTEAAPAAETNDVDFHMETAIDSSVIEAASEAQTESGLSRSASKKEKRRKKKKKQQAVEDENIGNQPSQEATTPGTPAEEAPAERVEPSIDVPEQPKITKTELTSETLQQIDTTKEQTPADEYYQHQIPTTRAENGGAVSPFKEDKDNKDYHQAPQELEESNLSGAATPVPMTPITDASFDNFKTPPATPSEPVIEAPEPGLEEITPKKSKTGKNIFLPGTPMDDEYLTAASEHPSESGGEAAEYSFATPAIEKEPILGRPSTDELSTESAAETPAAPGEPSQNMLEEGDKNNWRSNLEKKAEQRQENVSPSGEAGSHKAATPIPDAPDFPVPLPNAPENLLPSASDEILPSPETAGKGMESMEYGMETPKARPELRDVVERDIKLPPLGSLPEYGLVKAPADQHSFEPPPEESGLQTQIPVISLDKIIPEHVQQSVSPIIMPDDHVSTESISSPENAKDLVDDLKSKSPVLEPDVEACFPTPVDIEAHNEAMAVSKDAGHNKVALESADKKHSLIEEYHLPYNVDPMRLLSPTNNDSERKQDIKSGPRYMTDPSATGAPQTGFEAMAQEHQQSALLHGVESGHIASKISPTTDIAMDESHVENKQPTPAQELSLMPVQTAAPFLVSRFGFGDKESVSNKPFEPIQKPTEESVMISPGIETLPEAQGSKNKHNEEAESSSMTAKQKKHKRTKTKVTKAAFPEGEIKEVAPPKSIDVDMQEIPSERPIIAKIKVPEIEQSIETVSTPLMPPSEPMLLESSPPESIPTLSEAATVVEEPSKQISKGQRRRKSVDEATENAKKITISISSPATEATVDDERTAVNKISKKSKRGKKDKRAKQEESLHQGSSKQSKKELEILEEDMNSKAKRFEAFIDEAKSEVIKRTGSSEVMRNLELLEVEMQMEDAKQKDLRRRRSGEVMRRLELLEAEISDEFTPDGDDDEVKFWDDAYEALSLPDIEQIPLLDDPAPTDDTAEIASREMDGETVLGTPSDKKQKKDKKDEKSKGKSILIESQPSTSEPSRVGFESTTPETLLSTVPADKQQSHTKELPEMSQREGIASAIPFKEFSHLRTSEKKPPLPKTALQEVAAPEVSREPESMEWTRQYHEKPNIVRKLSPMGLLMAGKTGKTNSPIAKRVSWDGPPPPKQPKDESSTKISPSTEEKVVDPTEAGKEFGVASFRAAIAEEALRGKSSWNSQKRHYQLNEDERKEVVEAPPTVCDHLPVESTIAGREILSQRPDDHSDAVLAENLGDAVASKSPPLSYDLQIRESVRDSSDKSSSTLPHDIKIPSSTDTEGNSTNTLKISVEHDPAYKVSVSHDNQRTLDDTVQSSEIQSVPYVEPTEVSTPHSHDREARIQRQASPTGSIEEIQLPFSPVDSTSRPSFSQELFGSSPSTREKALGEGTSELDISRPREVENVDDSSKLEEIRSPSITDEQSFPDWTSLPPPRTSLFGGPVITDAGSPILAAMSPKTQLSDIVSPRRRLNTITETSPEESPTKPINEGGDGKSAGRSLHRVKSTHNSLRSLKTVYDLPPAELDATLADDSIPRLSSPGIEERRSDRSFAQHEARVNLESEFRSLSRQSHRSEEHLSEKGYKRPDSVLSNESHHSRRSIQSQLSQLSQHSQHSQHPSETPSLRRVDRSLSGDLRSTNQAQQAKQNKQTKVLAKSREVLTQETQFEPVASSSTYDPLKDKGKGRVKDMADVYEGWGDDAGSPLSPSRPPSMRRRQSLQILDLEQKLERLASENRLLTDTKSKIHKRLEDISSARSQDANTTAAALQARDLALKQKDSEISEMRKTLESLRKEVTRLKEVNEDLNTTNASLKSGNDRTLGELKVEGTHAEQKWQKATQELEDLRVQHNKLSSGMEEIVRHEISVALEAKESELRLLRNELEIAKEQIHTLQAQILAQKNDDILVIRNEDYFESACTKLCQHVQQWVLRFSKFSDNRKCKLLSEIGDEKVADRFDNAILDGSDVDSYLSDRVKRRDVFMSVAMSMVWEYIFTRYLFGMDREQRQKLKSLEKNLTEVGPITAVHKWRATTLTLLGKRKAFQEQRASDTEAVVQEIYHTLSIFLPPPNNLQHQILDSLRKVMRLSVALSIEMRTQRAEYIMLPPLQPEFDTNGDLARKVYFNASLMNERSGTTTSNEELEKQKAIVRMVLFPLVVKKGNDHGVGEEEVVVCPAQVLVAKPGKEKKVVRVVSGDRMSLDHGTRSGVSFDHGNRSVSSIAPTTLDQSTLGNMI
ncbi:MAG: hypothetical protein M1834_008284 [Cirrosporium novae-zelandiae]|nr:MAG: hypothetical protein M1834_008284 [Cirrosporium novae-zelandiae]